MIFKLSDILSLDFNSVDECDSLFACTVRDCLCFVPLRKPIYNFFNIFFLKKEWDKVGDYVGAH